MDICSGNAFPHDEIVHDSKECPLCEALSDKEILQIEYDKLEEEHSK